MILLKGGAKMKRIINVLVIAAIALALYSVIGRFVGGPTIGLGLICLKATTGLLVSNTLLLLAIFLKLIN